MGNGDAETPLASGAEPEKNGNVEATISPSPETPTTAEMLAEALEGEKIGARKLTFTEQCGAFAALYAGVRNQVVARAFGVSLQCASKISGCLEYDPDPYRVEYADGQNADLEMPQKVLRDHNRNRSPARHRHYETVAREFEALGVEEFNRRYYNERTHKRILLAKVQLREEKRGRK